MKKTILFLAIVFTLNSCKGQEEKTTSNNETIKNNNMEHFDIDKYKDWEIDSTFSNSAIDKHYKKDNRKIRVIYGGEEDFQVEESDDTPYITYKNFSLKTKSLLYSGKSFYNVNLGIWRYYNEDGSLIEERNEDSIYKLSVEDIIKIARQEHNIDLMDTTKKYSLERNDYQFPKYFITIFLGGPLTRTIIIDATTGKTVSDTETNGDDKLKKNKEGSKKMGYYEYREKGIRVHQIYQDVCYTEDEWNEFIKTKSWWWRKLNT